MSGDMRIKANIDGGLGGAHKLSDPIDAHSQKSGDFTEGRNIQGKQVFLTPEGAQALDGKIRDGFRFEAQKDPSGFFEKLMSSPETFTGKVNR
jgi:hypothetical protein